MRFRPEWGGHQISDRFFVKQVNVLGRDDYALIIVVQGEGVTGRTLTSLRAAFPRAKMVFYTWDSIENKPFSRRNLSHYDSCSTFDPVDAKTYGMNFRPLFFSPGFDRALPTSFSYDLSFIGTIHSDRYKIIQSLMQQMPLNSKAFVYLYLQAPWVFDLRRIFTGTLPNARREEFSFEPLGKKHVQDIFFSSRTVLDIEHPLQRGATMRTMEALGSHRKMITTNTALRDYDFFNPSNIHIIDRKTPRLDQDFLRLPFVDVQESVRQKYSLRQWVYDICKF